MESPEIIVVQPSIIEDDTFNNIMTTVYINSDPMPEKDFGDNQALLENVSSVLDDSDSGKIDIKLEDIDIGPEVILTPGFDTAINDECVAVEALRQLSNYSEEQLKNDIHPDLNDAEMNERAEKNYSCQICNSAFSFKKEYLNHLVCHSISRPHSCINCGSLFHLKKDLIEHMTVHAKIHTCSCGICNQTFTRTSSLINHLKMHSYTPGRAIKQEKISDTAELEGILTGNSTNMQTMIVKTEPDIIPIKIEPDIMPVRNKSETKSIKTKTDITPIKNIESNNSTKLSKLSDQYGVRLKEGKYQCNHCSALFRRETALASHIKVKHKRSDGDHLCLDCDIGFSTATDLEKHLKACSKHKRSLKTSSLEYEESFDKTRQCKKCDKRFATKQKLMQHVWVHRKQTHNCDECASNFDTIKALNHHRLTDHKLEEQHACEECGKSYCTHQGLTEHRTKVHQKGSGIGSYSCEVCSKTFSSRQGFHIHKRMHSGERPYGCKYCMKSFRDGGTLRKHERIHTGERPHVCAVCQKGFTQKVGLREHVRWVHAATPDANGLFSCSICQNNYTNRDELTVHFIYHSDKISRASKD